MTHFDLDFDLSLHLNRWRDIMKGNVPTRNGRIVDEKLQDLHTRLGVHARYANGRAYDSVVLEAAAEDVFTIYKIMGIISNHPEAELDRQDKKFLDPEKLNTVLNALPDSSNQIELTLQPTLTYVSHHLDKSQSRQR